MHQDRGRKTADEARELAGLDRVGAERRADGALLDDGELRGQRARAQLDREIVGALDREVARDLPRAAEDRLADDGRRDDLVVEHDGERLVDVILGEGAELARARLIEAEGDDRLVGLMVEAGLRIDEVVALDDGRLGEHVGAVASRLVAALGRLVDLVAERRARLLRLFRRHRGMHGMEGELRGLADELLELRGVAQARILDEDAVAALANDGQFRRAERVDTPVDGLDRGGRARSRRVPAGPARSASAE